MPVEIRRLTPADAAIWKAFRIEMLTTAPRAFGASLTDTKSRSLQDFADWLEKSHIFGFENPDLVASAAWYSDDSVISQHRAKLISVYVRPSHRGRGLVAQLVTTCIRDAQAAGKIQMELDVAADNHAAIRSYERLGFEKTGFLPRALCHDGIYTDDFQMMLRLDT